jgi:hypothetical protein
MRVGAITRAFAIHSVPPRIVLMTALTSLAGLMFTSLLGWPLWRIAATMLIPWCVVLTQETIWTYRHYGGLALFYVLVVTQTGHLFEHVAQMIQMHVLGLTGANAQGVIGTLDIEWVHFIFNTWVAIAAPILLWRFRRNAWLWAVTILSLWHEIEHITIMTAFLTTGKVGTPGLLSRGGLLGGGLPLVRADLHFLYNLAETVPLVVAFVYELYRYDEYRRGYATSPGVAAGVPAGERA